MPLIEALVAGMPWGLLLITDSASREFFDSDADPDQVQFNETGVIVPVIHAAEGEVTIRVWRDQLDPSQREVVFDGELLVDSGVLQVGALDGSAAICLPLEAGRHRVIVSVDETSESQSVDVYLPA